MNRKDLDILRAREDHAMKEFAMNLKQVRQSKNLSQKEIGERVGLTQYDVLAIEKGTRSLSFTDMIAITDAVGVDISEMFGAKSSGIRGDAKEKFSKARSRAQMDRLYAMYIEILDMEYDRRLNELERFAQDYTETRRIPSAFTEF